MSFRNEPLTDFAIAAERQKLSDALAALAQKLSREPLSAAPIIGGKEVPGRVRYERLDPSDDTTHVGTCRFATDDDVDRALTLLDENHRRWCRVAHEDRAAMLRRASAIMRERRHELSAIIIREAGKPWKEADADVAEAIDFLDYYALEVERIWPRRRTYDMAGEDNFYFYQPRGICVVISPWNFPLAIACGMTAAALVTGNSTILKPAEQTSSIAYELAKILFQAGIPDYAFAFLPGFGEEIGRKLVADPRTAMICFTGSKSVGLEIIRTAAMTDPTQGQIKKVVAELGGKNAIIVDDDADLDEAVKGTIYSAFGFSGQKCSACSRVIAVGDAYEPFMKRLAAATASVTIGIASDPSTIIGPVIDHESRQRISRTVDEGATRLKVAYKGEAPSRGIFAAPIIFGEVSTADPIWREEIFGPVLACRRAASFEEALVAANDSQYALTGGVFSRSPAHIKLAAEEFRVGNLYINRGTTGAYVCRQPFGGFKMSGIGSKAGGPDYLLQFVEPRVLTENTMRRGFTPESR